MKSLMNNYLAVFALCALGFQALGIEEPKYRVLEKSKSFELRAYEPMIIAEVFVDGNMKQASNRGFRLIADYIFGNNSVSNGGSEKIEMTVPVTMEPQSQKIAMTAPVTIEAEGADVKQAGQWRVHFVMPQAFDMNSLPKPNNPRVKIKAIPERNYAVMQFSGFSGAAKVEKKTQALVDWMKSQNLTPKGRPELARYNPPITPPFLRRNEVMVEY